jgi:hypothetical protein
MFKVKVARLTALVLLAPGAAVLISCQAEAPRGPRVTAWQEELRTHFNVKSVCVENGSTLWLVGEYPANSSESQGVILIYRDGKITEVYKFPEKDSTFYEVDFFGNEGWAVGVVSRGGKKEGIICKYVNGAWGNVENVPESLLGFFDVNAVGPENLWVAGAGEVFHCNSGVWSSYRPLGDVSKLAFPNTTRGFAWGENGETVWVFDGGDWSPEKPELPEGLRILSIKEGAVTDAGVYWSCSLSYGEFGYKGIFSRDFGAPGQGKYALDFFAPPGPYFTNITAIAYADAKNGIAVGTRTSVLCEAGDYYEEILPREFGNPIAAAASAPNDYWMVSSLRGNTVLLARHFR